MAEEKMTRSNTKIEDFPELNALAEQEDFDNGVENLKIYFRHTPHKAWEVLRNSQGEMVAYDISNILPNGIMFGFQTVVRKDYRKKRIVSSYLWGRPDAPTYPGEAGNHVNATLTHKVWAKDRMWQHKLHDWIGFVQHAKIPQLKPSQDFTIRPLDESLDLKSLLAYDESIIRLDRSGFLREWCFGAGAVSTLGAVAPNGHSLLGFGTLHQFSRGCVGVSPLYADSAEIAQSLFYQLAAKVADKELLYVEILANKSTIMECATKIGLEYHSAEMRGCQGTYLEYQRSIPMNKVYATHEFWPV